MATFDFCQIERNNSCIRKLIKTIKQAHSQCAQEVLKFQLSRAGSNISKLCIIGLLWEEPQVISQSPHKGPVMWKGFPIRSTILMRSIPSYVCIPSHSQYIRDSYWWYNIALVVSGDPLWSSQSSPLSWGLLQQRKPVGNMAETLISYLRPLFTAHQLFWNFTQSMAVHA